MSRWSAHYRKSVADRAPTGQKLNQRSDNPSPASAMIADGNPMIQRSRVRALRTLASTTTNGLTRLASTSNPASAVTIVAPVGRSNAYELARPAAHAAIPALHAISSTTDNLSENVKPMTAGTIRRLNTSSTPAVATELVTTIPNDRKKVKSHAATSSQLRPCGDCSRDNDKSGRRAHQCSRPITA